MGKWPRGWWENESTKEELLMPKLIPVTPIPRESALTHPNTVNGTIYRIIVFIYRMICTHLHQQTLSRVVPARCCLFQWMNGDKGCLTAKIVKPWSIHTQIKTHDENQDEVYVMYTHVWERFTLKVCVVLGLENTSSRCSLSLGCRLTPSSVTALCARLEEPLCFYKHVFTRVIIVN